MYDHIWAFESERIKDYFLERGAAENETGFLVEECTVEIIPLEAKSVGNLSLAQTRVIISGKNEDEVFGKFKLNFLSGGA